VSEGIISASGVRDGEKFLLTDALIKSGNSGGPLVNQKGELVGLVLSTIQTTVSNQELGRAYGNVIPSITIQEFLSHPRALCEGYLGVSGKTVSTGYGNLAASQGLQIERVLRTESGLVVGDILMMVEDSPISSPRNLISVVRSKTPGSRLKAFVIRNGTFSEVSLLVGVRPK
jgi:S1-C subfamily serine protease